MGFSVLRYLLAFLLSTMCCPFTIHMLDHATNQMASTAFSNYQHISTSRNVLLCYSNGKERMKLMDVSPCRGMLLMFVLSVNMAALFEVLDFPPFFGLVDAHSLWHALTVPLTPVWYRFICEDHRHLSGTRIGKAH
jgi:hypothetical protein